MNTRIPNCMQTNLRSALGMVPTPQNHICYVVRVEREGGISRCEAEGRFARVWVYV